MIHGTASLEACRKPDKLISLPFPRNVLPMTDGSMVRSRFPILTLIASLLALGLFVGATAAIVEWQPGPDRVPAKSAEVAP